MSAPATARPEGAGRLETPERVAVDLEVVGLGHRMLAFLVDAAVLLLGWFLVVGLFGLLSRVGLFAWLESLSAALRSLVLVAAVLANWAYGLLFEWRWNGQTPGKRALGLRVVRLDGGPYDLVTSAVRNLSRVVDGFPVWTYAVGLTSVAVTRDHRRLGDLLAGTVLVKDAAVDLSIYDLPEAEAGEGAEAAGAALSAEAWEVVAAWARRAPALEPAARRRIAVATARALGLEVEDEAAEARLTALAGRRPRAASGRRGADALVRFVRAHRADWEALERHLAHLAQGGLRLDALADLDRRYRSVTSDLAHAQTFFPGTVATAYLNRLAGRAYREIYRKGGGGRPALSAYLREGFPGAVWRARGAVGASAALLVLGAAAGALLTWADPAVADAVLGPRMMDTVRQGRVWTDDLLSVMPPSMASAQILTNNISVAIAAFLGGLTAGVGTAALLLLNGGLLGVAFVATARHGVAGLLADFVLAHGPVELSVIVLAGGAGFLLASALVSPGELSRADAVKVRGRDAVRIVLGGAALLVLVGVVEGFVSPGDLFPTWAKAALGFGLFAALWIWILRAGPRAPDPRQGAGERSTRA